jgi:metal-responsive CopG/Arc/MetJ family transcriptional regulator
LVCKKYYKLCIKSKRDFEKAVRTTVTIPPRLMQCAEAIFVGRGFVGFSDYIQELIRRDVDKRRPQMLLPR